MIVCGTRGPVRSRAHRLETKQAPDFVQTNGLEPNRPLISFKPMVWSPPDFVPTFVRGAFLGDYAAAPNRYLFPHHPHLAPRAVELQPEAHPLVQ